jgi:hypothetical protein
VSKKDKQIKELEEQNAQLLRLLELSLQVNRQFPRYYYPYYGTVATYGGTSTNIAKFISVPTDNLGKVERALTKMKEDIKKS